MPSAFILALALSALLIGACSPEESAKNFVGEQVLRQSGRIDIAELEKRCRQLRSSPAAHTRQLCSRPVRAYLRQLRQAEALAEQSPARELLDSIIAAKQKVYQDSGQILLDGITE